jgi:hypothetical protein
VLLAAALAIAYLVVQPATVDLAASVYRARLFGADGFSVWNGNWYSGHHTLSYSVLYPPLGWLLGPALVGAISIVASAALFEPLARHHFGERAARWGALWFGAAAATPVLSGRIPFAAGAAVGLGAALALQRERHVLAALLAITAGLFSPIAGLFLALAGVAYALAGRRRAGAAFAAAALLPPAVLSLLFPDGRDGPFSFSALWPLLLLAAGTTALLPARERSLRAAAVLYGLAGLAGYLVVNPAGGTVVRLGALVGGPLLLCALTARPPSGRVRRAAAVLVLLGLAAWQWSPAIRDATDLAGDPTTHAAFYRPLLERLDAAGGPPFRIEIPFTFSHWEAAEVAPHYPLARGWLRSDDTDYNPIFYEGRLDAATYRSWLVDHGVRFVAVPRAKLDYSAQAEARLIASRPPYLRPVWSSRDWRLYEVTAWRSLVEPGGTLALERLGHSSFMLRARAAGSAVVRVRWTPYWAPRGGCVEKAGEWTRVTAARAGTVDVHARFSLGRVFSRGRRCG